MKNTSHNQAIKHKNLENGGLCLPPLKSGKLIKRYKRFLADIILDDGNLITAHCPNSGSMKTCSDSGMRVWVSESPNPKRKLSNTWELIEMPSSLVGVNAILPNKLVKHAISCDMIPEASGYSEIIPEISTSGGTRLDLCLRSYNKPDCFIEIKNCTYVENRVASFPDAVTTRGKKHLEELQRLVMQGCRGIILYIVQRSDADIFMPADSIDREYSDTLRKAVASEVEVLAYDTSIDEHSIHIRRRLPVAL